MAGSSRNFREINAPRNMNLTLALFGRTGNGKSATGNSIIGKNGFESKASASGVTSVCQVQTTVLKTGQTVNVIDTPGFFDFSPQSEFIGDEIIKCFDLAKGGIHAILLVFSIRTRFSKEEEAVIHNLRTLFGENILRYTIVVFTGGDDLEESGLTLAGYLGSDCPDPLKRIIHQTENKCVLFNNMTKDQNEKDTQIRILISTVNDLILRNKGNPFVDELFDLQAGALKLRGKAAKDVKFAQQMDEQMKKVIQEVESRLKSTTIMLEKQLAEAQEGRKKAEHLLERSQNTISTYVENAKRTQMESDEAIQALRERLRIVEKQKREFHLPTIPVGLFEVVTPLLCSFL